MLTVVQRGGATHEKPPEAVRGQSSRLPWAWDGLCVAVPFNDATRDSARDLVANAAPNDYANYTWTKDDRGNTAVRLPPANGFYPNAGRFEYPHNPAHARPATAITAYARLRKVGTSDGGGGIFTKVHTENTSPFNSWTLHNDDTTNPESYACYMVLDTSGGFGYDLDLGGYTVPTTGYYSLFMRWRSGETLTLHLLDERGRIVANTASITTLTGNILYTTAPMRVNTSDIYDRSGNAEYSQCMLWSRRLTDVELQALVADPFGWYSPRRETIGVSSPYPLFAGQSFMREVPSG